MYVETKLEYLYYEFEGTYYKIPHGRILKIIDFGRATFQHKGIIFFSDVFDEDGDADDNMITLADNSLKNVKLNQIPL